MVTGERAERTVVLTMRLLAAAFAVTGVLFIVTPDGVIDTLGDVGDELGEFAPGADSDQRLWLGLAFAYMVVITGIALVVQSDVRAVPAAAARPRRGQGGLVARGRGLLPLRGRRVRVSRELRGRRRTRRRGALVLGARRQGPRHRAVGCGGRASRGAGSGTSPGDRWGATRRRGGGARLNGGAGDGRASGCDARRPSRHHGVRRGDARGVRRGPHPGWRPAPGERSGWGRGGRARRQDARRGRAAHAAGCHPGRARVRAHELPAPLLAALAGAARRPHRAARGEQARAAARPDPAAEGSHLLRVRTRPRGAGGGGR